MHKCRTCPVFSKSSQCYSKYSEKPGKSTAAVREVMHVAGRYQTGVLLEVLQNNLKQCKYFRKPKSVEEKKKYMKKVAGFFLIIILVVFEYVLET